tara:strand:- start:472 stop:1002 length:531 start_codon:yes stop_codon:yes gene_type:complete
MWGFIAKAAFSFAVTAVTSLIQMNEAKSDAKKVNALIDERNKLNNDRIELESTQKKNVLYAQNRKNAATMASNRMLSGGDTEGGRQQIATTGADSSLTSSLDYFEKGTQLNKDISSKQAEAQKLANKGPGITSVLAGVAGTVGAAGIESLDFSSLDAEDTDTTDALGLSGKVVPYT